MSNVLVITLIVVFMALSKATVFSQKYTLNPEFNDKKSNKELLGEHDSLSLTKCAAMCQGVRECCFYGFNPQKKKCRTHKKIFTSGVFNEVDWRYYADECCLSGWRRYQDHCYLFQQTFLNWNEAKTNCTNNGAYLVEIDTKDEDDWLVEQISMRNGGKNENQYLGATSHAQLGVWRWSTDNALISYSNFWPGQPNLYSAERCIVLDWDATYGTYKWGDTRCEMTRKFICEKDL